MNKIYFFILFSLLFTQNKITTRQFNLFKTNEMKSIDFSELINDINGEYMVELISIKDPDFKRTKRILVEPCDLQFTLRNADDNIKVSRCTDQYNFDGKILISEDNYNISINYPKYNYLNCTFIFWVSGNYVDVIGDNDITRDGILNEYYDDGDLKIEYSFENGKKHGLQKRWYNNNFIF